MGQVLPVLSHPFTSLALLTAKECFQSFLESQNQPSIGPAEIGNLEAELAAIRQQNQEHMNNRIPANQYYSNLSRQLNNQNQTSVPSSHTENYDDSKLQERLDKQREKHEKDLEKRIKKMEADKARQEKEFERERQRIEKEAQQKYQQMEQYYKERPKHSIRIPKDAKKAVEEAVKKHQIDNENFYNFGFVGHVKMGKSSMINALRGLYSFDPDAAKVDVLECTPGFQMFTFPNGILPTVRLYDCAGSGSMTHNSDGYYEDKALCAFDCLIIMVQDTPGEEEIAYAKTAMNYNQKVVFVRSRCDLDFDKINEYQVKVTPTPQQIQAHIKKLREHFKAEIIKHAPELVNVKIFFVSAKSLRCLVIGESADMNFEEKQFIDFIHEQSMKSRGM
jgi:hypothetical protein